MNNKKSLKLSLILTNIFLILLLIMVIALPWLVYWYVETMHRSPTLPTTILITCYPCSPFVAAALISLRKLIKSIYNENSEELRITYFKRIYISCIIIAIITLIAGKFYLPFFIVAGTFAFLSLLTFTFKNIYESALSNTVNNKNAKE